jgi:predicted NAD-dependent protein-ADP-ribosyltransferase YbiA (DUF1768 family)
VTYDLFADGKTWLTKDQYVTVVVNFADGTTRDRVLRLSMPPESQ